MTLSCWSVLKRLIHCLQMLAGPCGPHRLPYLTLEAGSTSEYGTLVLAPTKASKEAGLSLPSGRAPASCSAPRPLPCLQHPERPLRPSCCYENGIVLLDLTSTAWTIKYANHAMCSLMGLDPRIVEGEDVWSLLGVEDVVGAFKPLGSLQCEARFAKNCFPRMPRGFTLPKLLLPSQRACAQFKKSNVCSSLEADKGVCPLQRQHGSSQLNQDLQLHVNGSR